MVTTLVAVAVIWRYLFHTRYGLLNYALGALGIDPIDWLGDPHWAMPAIILFAVWKNFGYNMVILLAGLQSIPEELYEAARIDGASCVAAVRATSRCRCSRRSLLLVGILTMAGYFQLFAEPYVMTQGGPLQSTVSVLYFMYEEGFKWWNLGTRVGGRVPAVRHHASPSPCVPAAHGAASGSRMNAPVRRAGSSTALLARRGGRHAVSAAVDGVGVVHGAGRGQHAIRRRSCPRQPTLDNYRELFAHAGMGRYLVNSVLLAVAATAAVAAVQRRGRLRLRQAALRRPRPHLQAAARRAGHSRRRWRWCRCSCC